MDSRSFTDWLLKAVIAISALAFVVIFVVGVSSQASAGTGSVEQNSDTSIALTDDVNRTIKTGRALHFTEDYSIAEIADRKYYGGDVVTSGFVHISNESPDARWASLVVEFNTHEGEWPHWFVETRSSDGSWLSGPTVVEGNSTNQVQFRVVVGNNTGEGTTTVPRLVLYESPIPECANTQCG